MQSIMQIAPKGSQLTRKDAHTNDDDDEEMQRTMEQREELKAEARARAINGGIAGT